MAWPGAAVGHRMQCHTHVMFDETVPALPYQVICFPSRAIALDICRSYVTTRVCHVCDNSQREITHQN